MTIPVTYEAFGKKRTVTQWLDEPECILKNRAALAKRLKSMPAEEAISAQPLMYEAFGELKTWADWSKDPRFTVKERTARTRLYAGWNFEQAISGDKIEPLQRVAFGENKSISEWLKDERCIPNERTLWARLQSGLDFETAITRPLREDRTVAQRYDAFGLSLSLAEWAKSDLSNIQSPATLHSRLAQGMSIEDALTEPLMSGSSIGEKQLAEFLARHVDIETGCRSVIPPKELDIFIPSLNVGIEFNGCYWHSDQFLDKNYHHNKYLACREKGIRLIQIWEDDWMYRRSVVERMLLHKLGLSSGSVYARLTTVDNQVDPAEAEVFLEANHIQGNVNTSHSYGLRYSDELVALLCVKKLTGEKEDWDLVRYATNQSVVGGFSKLLKAFMADHSGTIKTFADLCLSDGGLYEASGFRQVAVVPPDYFYIQNGSIVREHKFNYRKANFESRPDLKFEDGSTESELAALNNLHRVYDAGKIKYVITCRNNK